MSDITTDPAPDDETPESDEPQHDDPPADTADIPPANAAPEDAASANAEAAKRRVQVQEARAELEALQSDVDAQRAIATGLHRQTIEHMMMTDMSLPGIVDPAYLWMLGDITPDDVVSADGTIDRDRLSDAIKAVTAARPKLAASREPVFYSEADFWAHHLPKENGHTEAPPAHTMQVGGWGDFLRAALASAAEVQEEPAAPTADDAQPAPTNEAQRRRLQLRETRAAIDALRTEGEALRDSINAARRTLIESMIENVDPWARDAPPRLDNMPDLWNIANADVDAMLTDDGLIDVDKVREIVTEFAASHPLLFSERPRPVGGDLLSHVLAGTAPMRPTPQVGTWHSAIQKAKRSGPQRPVI